MSQDGGDSDFEYGDQYSDQGSPQGKAEPATVANMPHDEEVNLTDDESEAASPMAGGQETGGVRGGDSPPANISDAGRDSDEEDDHDDPSLRGTGGAPEAGDDMGQHGDGGEKGYVAEDYKDLPCSEEIRDLFQYIGRYKPHTPALDTKLKPFIPDYIPAVGDIDEFIKVPRPDGKPDDLGLKVLDEPSAKQSDTTVLNLKLRQISKQSNLQPMNVTSVEHADKNPKRVTQWIDSLADLHKGKPPPVVNYTKNMPDIESLMSEWPPEMEQVLNEVRLPDGTLDMDAKTFTRILCGILDIPTYNNVVESLHVLFTLYLEFSDNPFMAGAAGGEDDGIKI
mmetsp:Transcript_12236/g.42442  ORF Transcript_12236/g.42442 Transcript_12236/m.42442 type:complete len:338 (+) Transcript_12236:251-1264(+)